MFNHRFKNKSFEKNAYKVSRIVVLKKIYFFTSHIHRLGLWFQTRIKSSPYFILSESENTLIWFLENFKCESSEFLTSNGNFAQILFFEYLYMSKTFRPTSNF